MLIESLASPDGPFDTDLQLEHQSSTPDIGDMVDANPNATLLDDIFGSDSETETETAPPTQVHTLDSQRQITARSVGGREFVNLDTSHLRLQHHKAGYRDGLTAAKELHVQAGFDEGFELAAEVGLVVGRVLGKLRGLLAELRGGKEISEQSNVEMARRLKDCESRGDGAEVINGSMGVDGGIENDDSKTQSTDDSTVVDGTAKRAIIPKLEAMLAIAEKDFSISSVFSLDYFGKDGVWTFKVPDEKTQEKIGFHQVAMAHPLVRKWTYVLACLSRRFGVNLILG